MAVVIDDSLSASPATISLPSGPIELAQGVHSDLGGEMATITYTISGPPNVAFQTSAGPEATVVLQGVEVPGTSVQRSDTVKLVRTAPGAVAQVEIRQTIEAEDTAFDSVTVAVRR